MTGISWIRLTDHVLAQLGDGKLSYLGGGIEEDLARRSAQEEALSAPSASSSNVDLVTGPGADD